MNEKKISDVCRWNRDNELVPITTMPTVREIFNSAFSGVIPIRIRAIEKLAQLAAETKEKEKEKGE